MDLDGHSERGDEDHLLLVQLLGMDVTLDVARDGMLGPAPVSEGGGEELEPAAGGGEATQDAAVDLDPDRAPAVGVGLGRGQRDDVGPGRPWRLGVNTTNLIDFEVIELLSRDRLLMQRPHLATDLEGPIAAHVLERAQALARRFLRQPGDRVLEDISVVLVDAQLGAGLPLRLEVLADPERPVGIDAPGELHPELVLLPDLTRIGLTSVGDRFAQPLARSPQHRLAKAEPLGVVGLVGVEVVAFGAVPHREHVVGKIGALVPGRCERGVQPDLGLVAQSLDPGEPVGVGPDRVVDAREVDLEPLASFVQELWQEERHLHEGQWILEWPCELVPLLGVRRHVHRPGHELVPGVGKGATLGGHRPHKTVQQKQAS